MHDIRTLDEVQAVLKPGGAMEAFEAAKKAGKCRLIGFTGHFDPDAHVAMLKVYDRWDTVMMPIHPADHAYLSFEQTAFPVSAARGVPNQTIKVFGKANLLRFAETGHVPPLRAEPTGCTGRRPRVRHGWADGGPRPGGAELSRPDA